MKNKLSIWISVFALTLACVIAATTSLAATNEQSDVKDAVEEFYAALNAMFTGELEPMTKIWSHAADVTYMGPAGGFRVGWDQVLGDWEAQAVMKLGGKVESADVRITIGTNIAVVHNYERGKNVDPQGVTQDVSIRATNIFRLEDGAWKMIGHHTDLLPALME